MRCGRRRCAESRWARAQNERRRALSCAPCNTALRKSRHISRRRAENFVPAGPAGAIVAVLVSIEEEDAMTNSTRRDVLGRGAALAAAGALAGSGLLKPSRARAQTANIPMPEVKAL